MSNFDFETWFERIWLLFPKDLFSSDDKGNKQQAKAAAKTKVKSAKKAQEVYDATEAWIRFKRYKKSRNEFFSYFPQVVRWFRHSRWEDEIPSFSDKDKPEREIKGKQHPSHTLRPKQKPAVIDKDKAKIQIQSIRSVLK